MNVNRTLTLTVISGALLAWFAGAATSKRDVQPPIVLPTPAVDLRGADLSKEIARLHERLRPDALPRQQARNLFTYHVPVRHDVPALAAAPKPALSEAPAALAQPPMRLEGIAEEDGPDGPVRTAIISAEGQLFLVKPGDALGPRYHVERVTADVVELTDAIDHSLRRLALK